jgi:hypothetical protein
VLQQNPSTQWASSHCESAEHIEPTGRFSTHTPPAQNSVAAQPASFVHPPPQIEPEHGFAPHDW